MGPTKAPNKIEREWLDLIADEPCQACTKDGLWSAAEVHHITSAGRRMGHLFTIKLCPTHHRGDGKQVPSVHGSKKSFERRYGTQLELLAELQVLMGVYDKVTV